MPPPKETGMIRDEYLGRVVMDLQLADRTALVTGASRGIGAAIAAELARQGVNVCLVARDAARLEAVAGGLADAAARPALTLAADLRDPAEPARVVAAAMARFGRLDLLVNNAGATRRADFFDLSEDDWQDGFALKFHGYVRMTRAAWPHLRAVRGSIVNIIGIGGRIGTAEFTIGGSVNAALMNFTKAMAAIGIQDGVRVNAINPGLIETDRFNGNVERVMREGGLTQTEAVASLLRAHGTPRLGRPEEIGHLAAYLASPLADFVQGALIDVDGGTNRAM